MQNDIQLYTQRMQERLMEMLAFTIDFLNRHNLQWWACGGTAIGAVRHQGIIPWDDDIDLYMLRDDYNRLLELRGELRSEGFDILSLQDKGYYLPFAKIIDPNTTIVEFKEYTSPLGLFVDIFPVDCFDTSRDYIAHQQRKMTNYISNYAHTLKSYSFKEYLAMLRENCYSDKVKRLLLTCFAPMFRWYYKKKLQGLHRGAVSFRPGIYCACLSISFDKPLKSDWFTGYEELPFGNQTMRMPLNYDEYLTLIYGDYMTPPPPEQRTLWHTHYYVNLKERVSHAEAVRRREKGIQYDV